VVAVGSLTAVWTDLPDQEDEMRFKKEFCRIFGAPWEELMVGADKPYDFHCFWDGFLAVSSMERISGVTVADLSTEVTGTTRQLGCNIIIG